MAASLTAIFFGIDIEKILTPFVSPFVFLLFVAVYLLLFIASLPYALVHFRKDRGRALIPFTIHGITAVMVVFLLLPLHNLRMNTEFLIRKDCYNRVIVWVDEALRTGEIRLEQDHHQKVGLPDRFEKSCNRKSISLLTEDGSLHVYFSLGIGMFEYDPGFMYRPDDAPPPMEWGEIHCRRKLAANWYACV